MCLSVFGIGYSLFSEG
jgi:hypothetical protein